MLKRSVVSRFFRRAAIAPSLFPTYQLSKIEGTRIASVYGSCTLNHRGHGRRVLHDADPEIAVDKRLPEVEVLFPERNVGSESPSKGVVEVPGKSIRSGSGTYLRRC